MYTDLCTTQHKNDYHYCLVSETVSVCERASGDEVMGLNECTPLGPQPPPTDRD